MLNPLNDGRPLKAMRKGPVKLGSAAVVRPSAVGSEVRGADRERRDQPPRSHETGTLLWSFVVRPVGEIYEGGAGVQRGSPRWGGAGGSGAKGRLITSLPGERSRRAWPVRRCSFPRGRVDPRVRQGPRRRSHPADGEAGLALAPGDVVSGQPPLTLIFRLSDEAAGVNETTVKVEIDGKPATFNYTPRRLRPGRLLDDLPAITTRRRSAPGRPRQAEVEPDPPRRTPQHRRDRVTDWMGNVAKQTYSHRDRQFASAESPSRRRPDGAVEPSRKGRPGGSGGGRVRRWRRRPLVASDAFWQLLLAGELSGRKARLVASDLGPPPRRGEPPAPTRGADRSRAAAYPRRVARDRRRDARILVDEEMPEHLREAEGPPAIFVDGDASALDCALRRASSGTRNASAYGRACAQKFAEGLARAGVTVVSGGSAWASTPRPTSARSRADGRTAAVLAGGRGHRLSLGPRGPLLPGARVGMPR